MCLGRSTTKDAYLIKDINKSGPNDPGRITGSGSAAGMSEGEEASEAPTVNSLQSGFNRVKDDPPRSDLNTILKHIARAHNHGYYDNKLRFCYVSYKVKR